MRLDVHGRNCAVYINGKSPLNESEPSKPQEVEKYQNDSPKPRCFSASLRKRQGFIETLHISYVPSFAVLRIPIEADLLMDED